MSDMNELAGEETTRHMIRTPFGILSMGIEVFSVFSKASDELQWRVLSRVSKLGFHGKAQAMQWFWTNKEKKNGN